jgi:hypothetical protein
MDPKSGRLYPLVDKIDGVRRMVPRDSITPEEAQRRGYVPVFRELTEHERARKQIALYSPCACGSGKKLKFCCYTGGKP